MAASKRPPRPAPAPEPAPDEGSTPDTGDGADVASATSEPERPAPSPVPREPISTYRAPQAPVIRCGGYVLGERGWVLDQQKEA